MPHLYRESCQMLCEVRILFRISIAGVQSLESFVLWGHLYVFQCLGFQQPICFPLGVDVKVKVIGQMVCKCYFLDLSLLVER